MKKAILKLIVGLMLGLVPGPAAFSDPFQALILTPALISTGRGLPSPFFTMERGTVEQ